MESARRLFIASLGAALAGCGGRGRAPPAAGPLHASRLEADFPRLAARALPGAFRAGLSLLETGEAWSSDEVGRCPMQSVFKAPLAAAALAEVDAGRLTLGERIRLTELDLSPPLSAIDQAWPTPPGAHIMDIPAVDLIALAIQKSDNTAADVIMKRIGGPGAVTAWLRSKSITGISIDRYERELQQEMAGMTPFQPAWKDEAAWIAARDAVPALVREAAMGVYLADPRDTATVPATLDFLGKLGRGDMISPASTKLLLRLMTATDTGAKRLKAGLPAGASLAHKTGSARTDLGLTPATNDVGIVTLKDGRRLAVAAYLTGSTATEAERDRLFADTARLMVAALH